MCSILQAASVRLLNAMVSTKGRRTDEASVCTIAMCHSNLYPWQGFSGGKNRHKQKGLLQKTDIHSIAQASSLINQAYCGMHELTSHTVSHLGEEQGRELSMYNVTLPYSRALLVRSDKISLHIRLMLFRESICRNRPPVGRRVLRQNGSHCSAKSEVCSAISRWGWGETT